MELKYCKLEIFLPPTHLEVVQKALQEVDAGHIGNYDSCMSVSPVTGYWRPLDGCDPYIGRNKKDFLSFWITLLSPEELLNIYS